MQWWGAKVRTEECYFNDPHPNSQHTARRIILFSTSSSLHPSHTESRETIHKELCKKSCLLLVNLLSSKDCFCFERHFARHTVHITFSFFMETLKCCPQRVSLSFLAIKTVSYGDFHKGFSERASLFTGN